jgi:hypothetical protein
LLGGGKGPDAAVGGPEVVADLGRHRVLADEGQLFERFLLSRMSRG